MVLVKDNTAGATVQAPPIVEELQAVFDKLDDALLLQALIGPTRRGPKGHSAQALWRCFVAKYVLGLESTRELIRMLTNNPFVAEVCGVASSVPHEATFSRFFAKLSRYDLLPRLKDVSRALVRRHYANLPGFGERVALDSSTLRGWSNGGKKRPADRDAGWSVKKNTHGKTEYTYGWKLHLLVDCEYELPISANVSAGNVHDSKKASSVLREARFTTNRFHPSYVLAAKGYSGRPLFVTIHRQYGARPIIDILPGHKKLLAEMGEERKTPEWKALYKQRQAVERAFSRLKGQRSLNHIRVRGLRVGNCRTSAIMGHIWEVENPRV